MTTRLRNTLALLTVFIGIGTVGAWPFDDHETAAGRSTLSGCISHAFPTAEAGFALQRTAAAS